LVLDGRRTKEKAQAPPSFAKDLGLIPTKALARKRKRKNGRYAGKKEEKERGL